MKNSIIILLLCLPLSLLAQEDNLIEILETRDSTETEYVDATFKGTRLILGHSVKTRTKKQFEFLISHRFGRLNSGVHNFFGLDDAQIRLGFEYGLSNRINIGIGRSSYDKTYDGFIKLKLLQQKRGAESFPFTVVLLNSTSITTTPREEDDPTIEFNDRIANSVVVLIGGKINTDLSWQIMPAWVHRQKVSFNDKNDIYAIGMGGRYKLTRSLALNLEYYYRWLNAPDNPANNSFSVGFDIETGGHVFQLHFTNSIMTLEKSFITETYDDFWSGDIHFGFNISRTFHLGKDRSW